MIGIRKAKRYAKSHDAMILIGSLVLVLLSTIGLCFGSSLDQYFHKDCKFNPPPDWVIDSSKVKPISPRQAAEFAVRRLQARRVKDIAICEVSWITAPLGGYLVDAKGRATINGNDFSSFRVGIRDGSDYWRGNYSAGEEFVFFALGADRSGKSLWYPSPGPDYQLAEGEVMTEGMLAYEFLLRRKDFESLGIRFP